MNNKEGKEIKITDKRMFTPDGELREEYRFLEEKSTAAPEPAAPPAVPPPPPARAAAAPGSAAAAPAAAGRPGEAGASRPEAAQAPASDRSSRRAAAAREEPQHRGAGAASGPAPGASGHWEPAPPHAGAAESSARIELPGSPPDVGPTFYDLVALLAEPVAIYLGDMELPDGESAENLEMARLYIDLLDVLRQKTAGNLTAQESAFLEDLLYRLRVRYLQKRG